MDFVLQQSSGRGWGNPPGCFFSMGSAMKPNPDFNAYRNQFADMKRERRRQQEFWITFAVYAIVAVVTVIACMLSGRR
jgi:predicted nucleic acid-binding Zn ribbon protein